MSVRELIGSNERERETGRLGERQVESMVAKATPPLIQKLVISYCKGQAGEKERAREQGIKRVRERDKKKGKAFGISSPLKEDASQEFLLIYLPICSRGGIMEKGRGRGGEEESERGDR